MRMRSLFAFAILLNVSVAHAGLDCVMGNLRSLLQRRAPTADGAVPPATIENVRANPSLYTNLSGSMRSSVERAVESGRLKIIRVTRADNGEITGYELLPAEIVPGRYYSTIRLPDGSIAIGEFDYRNGIHTAMSRAFGHRPREGTFPNGLACGGIIFYDVGALVGGYCRDTPDPRNLRDISRALRRMGIRVDRNSTPGRIVETNAPIRREDIDTAPMRF